jgi:hypothetical protein
MEIDQSGLAQGRSAWWEKAEPSRELIAETPEASPTQPMYYLGLDVHKRKISYCVKDGSGRIHSEGSIPTARYDLDCWMKTLPQPWSAAMEATMFMRVHRVTQAQSPRC